MKSVSAKYVAAFMKATREYYADSWENEQGCKELLQERIDISQKLENETDVSWFGWESILSGIYTLDPNATDKEALGIIRLLGYNVKEESDEL